MDKLLTIVIPTYNMQDYLHRCLDSLVLKPELMECLEVLVINDGSKDNSSVIAHEYASKYPQTFRVIDKENGNYGSCVNRGLAEAQGKYIKILDADDWFDTTEFEKYLGKLLDVEVDMVLTPYNSVMCNSGTKKLETKDIQVETTFDFNTFPIDKLSFFPMHMVTYRTEMLKTMGYFQTEGVSYTDTEWAIMPLYVIKQFVFFPLVVYQYLVGRDGQTVDPNVMIRNAWHFEPILKAMIENRNRYVANKTFVSGLADSINRGEMEKTAERLYKMVLVKHHTTEQELMRLKLLDDYLKEKGSFVYDYLSNLRIKHFPIYYVRFWRRTGKRLPVDWLKGAFRRFLYGKQ